MLFPTEPASDHGRSRPTSDVSRLLTIRLALLAQQTKPSWSLIHVITKYDTRQHRYHLASLICPSHTEILQKMSLLNIPTPHPEKPIKEVPPPQKKIQFFFPSTSVFSHIQT